MKRMKAPVIVSLLAFLGVLSFAKVADAEDLINNDATITQLSDCVRSSFSLEAVVLVDESVSLVTTDNQGRRVALAKDIVSALTSAAIIEVDGVKPRIDVLVVGFGSDIASLTGEPVTERDWVTLDESTAPTLVESLSNFETRNKDRDTDYVDALQNASRLLGEHAQEMKEEGRPEPCRLIVWFTDGKFDIEKRSTPRPWATLILDPAEAEKLGRQILCSAEGVADSLRSQNTYLFTAALTSSQFGTNEQETLRGITLGDPSCGSESAVGLGWYRENGDFLDLRKCITLGLNGFPCGPDDPPGSTCTAARVCDFAFEVTKTDGLIRGVVRSISGEGQIILVPPGSTASRVEFTRDSESLDVPGARLSYSGNDGLYSFSLNPAPESDDAIGEWTFYLISEEDSDIQVNLTRTPDFGFKLQAPQLVEINSSFEVVIQLTGRDQNDAVLRDGISAFFSIDFVDGAEGVELSSSEILLSEGGQAAFRVKTGKEALGGFKLRVRGKIEADDGSVYQMSPRDLVVQVSDPGLPSFPKQQIDFGFLSAQLRERSTWLNPDVPEYEQLSGLTTIRKARGASYGDGYICWREPLEFESLSDSKPVVTLQGAQPIDDLGACISIGEDEERDLVFEIRFGNPVSGSLNGAGEIVLVSVSTGQQTSLPVSVLAQVDRPNPPVSRPTDIVVWEFVKALLIPFCVYLVGVILLAVLWRTKNHRRVWKYDFKMTRTTKEMSSAKQARGGFLEATGGIFSPWRAVHRDTNTFFMSWPAIGGSPRVTIKGQEIHLSSGSVADGPLTQVKFKTDRLWRRLRRQYVPDKLPFGSMGVVTQPLTGQWVVVNLRRNNQSISGSLLIVGPSEQDPTEGGGGGMTMDERAREVLTVDVRQAFEQMLDGLS